MTSCITCGPVLRGDYCQADLGECIQAGWTDEHQEGCLECEKYKPIFFNHDPADLARIMGLVSPKKDKGGVTMDNTIGVTTKICTRCKNPLPADTDNFYRDKNSKDGLTCWCKKCQGEDKKEKKAKKEVAALITDTKRKPVLKKRPVLAKEKPEPAPQNLQKLPRVILEIDLTEYPDLLNELEDMARKQFRFPEQQALWILNDHINTFLPSAFGNQG